MDPYIIALYICSKLLQSAPDQDFLTKIRNDELFSAWPLEPVSPEAREALAELAQVYGQAGGQVYAQTYGGAAADAERVGTGDSAGDITGNIAGGITGQTGNDAALAAEAQLLHQEHLLLFSGPAPLAPPWESVWREKERLLFGEQTVLVRQCYNEWGLELVDAGRSPEDHLGFELAFVVHLLQAWAARGVQGTQDTGGAQSDAKILEALTDFLDEHLLQWAEPCLRQVMKSATLPFYRGVGLLCLDALFGLRERLDSGRIGIN